MKVKEVSKIKKSKNQTMTQSLPFRLKLEKKRIKVIKTCSNAFISQQEKPSNVKPCIFSQQQKAVRMKGRNVFKGKNHSHSRSHARNVVPSEISFEQPLPSVAVETEGQRFEQPLSSNEVRRSEVSGVTSNTIVSDLELVLKLYKDERHLVAYKLYKESIKRMEVLETMQNSTLQTLEERMMLSKHATQFSRLNMCGKLFEECRDGIAADSWIYSHSLLGISTYYRHEKDNTFSVKLEGELEDVPLFEQMAVLREFDLYHTWAPFVTQSKVLSQLARCDFVGWFLVNIPFMLCRDAVFRALCCDCLMEDGTILINSKGLTNHTDSNNQLGLGLGSGSELGSGLGLGLGNHFNIPDPPKSWNGARMDINSFSGVIHITSPTSAKTTLVANINPHLPLIPKSWIEFALKKICGVLFHKMGIAARQAVKDPLHCPHAIRIRQDVDFYHKWLLPKFKRYCAAFQWDMPNIKAFEAIDTITTIDHDDMTSNTADHPHLHTFNDNHVHAPIAQIDHDVCTHPPPTTTTQLSFWSQQKQKQQLQKDRRIELQRQKLLDQLRPSAITPENKRRLQALEHTKHKLQAQYDINYQNIHNYNTNNTKNNKPKSYYHSFKQHFSIAKPTILLLLELTLFHNLDYDLLSHHFNPDLILHTAISCLETLLLMTLFIYFYSFVIYYSLLQIFDILETSVLHYHDVLLEVKRYYTTTIQTKFKTLLFTMILLWTTFCTLVYAIGSYCKFNSFIQHNSMKYLLLHTTKTFFIYSSTFMVSFVMFLYFLSGTTTTTNTTTKDIITAPNSPVKLDLSSPQPLSIIDTTNFNQHASCSDNSVPSKHSGGTTSNHSSGINNNIIAQEKKNENEIISSTISSPNNKKYTPLVDTTLPSPNNKDSNINTNTTIPAKEENITNKKKKKPTAVALITKSKYDFVKMRMKSMVLTYTNKIVKPSSSSSPKNNHKTNSTSNEPSSTSPKNIKQTQDN